MFGHYAAAPQHGCELYLRFTFHAPNQFQLHVKWSCFSTDYYATSNTMSLGRPSTSAVSGGAQHVANPLASAQGAPVVPQGTLQQPTQQAQSLPTMGIPLTQAGMLLLNT